MIGRLYTVHPDQDKCFFVSMLLVNVSSSTSFQQLRIINGVTHGTFQIACQALNLLENDRHWDVCINDACNASHPNQSHALSAIVLTAYSPSSPSELWEEYKSHMAKDIFRRILKKKFNTQHTIVHERINLSLIDKSYTLTGIFTIACTTVHNFLLACDC